MSFTVEILNVLPKASYLFIVLVSVWCVFLLLGMVCVLVGLINELSYEVRYWQNPSDSFQNSMFWITVSWLLEFRFLWMSIIRNGFPCPVFKFLCHQTTPFDSHLHSHTPHFTVTPLIYLTLIFTLTPLIYMTALLGFSITSLISSLISMLIKNMILLSDFK